MAQTIFDQTVGEEFHGILSNHYDALCYTVFTFIALLSIFLVFLPKYVIGRTQRKMNEVSSMFILISQSTLIEHS